MGGPLGHVRVLELSRVLAGPWAAQTLADLGASVIKVEKPGAGDDTRSYAPPYAANRDGFAKYGLDYPSLQPLNPGLIYCSITGFGQTGPYRHKPGYDFMIQGIGGLMSITGEPDQRPGGGPMKVGVAVADVFTGLYATIAILGALSHRDRTGTGQHIDLALLDTQVAVLANQAMNYLVTGVAPQRLGNSHPNIVPYQVFATSDGYIIVAVGNETQFARMCEVIGRPDLASDERFATNAARVNHRGEIVAILHGI